MKNAVCLFALLLGLAACVPAVATRTSTAITATATPIPSPPNTLSPTDISLPTAIPTPGESPTSELPHYFAGLAKTMDQIIDIGSMDNLITLANYFASPEQMKHPVVSTTQWAGFNLLKEPDVTEASFSCNYQGSNTCAILATARLGDRGYIIVQIATKTGPKNALIFLGSSHVEGDAKVAQIMLDRLNNGKGFELDIVTVIITPDYDNPEVHALTVGPNDPVPDGSVQLEKGVITNQQQVNPMWGDIVQ